MSERSEFAKILYHGAGPSVKRVDKLPENSKVRKTVEKEFRKTLDRIPVIPE